MGGQFSVSLATRPGRTDKGPARRVGCPIPRFASARPRLL